MTIHDLALLVIATAFLTAWTEDSTPKNAQPSVPAFQANARVVIVDVVVTDAAGRVVHGLKAQDFTVLEDSKLQTVIGFDENRPEASPKSKPPPLNLLKNEYTNYAVRNDTGALTVSLLDTLNSSRQDLARARNELPLAL